MHLFQNQQDQVENFMYMINFLFSCLYIYLSKFGFSITGVQTCSLQAISSLLFCVQPRSYERFYIFQCVFEIYRGFPSGSDVKISAYNVGDPDSILGWGRSPGEGNGCLCVGVFLSVGMCFSLWKGSVWGCMSECGCVSLFEEGVWVGVCICVWESVPEGYTLPVKNALSSGPLPNPDNSISMI